MPMKIATRTTVLSQMLVFRSNGDAKTVALHLTRLTMWGYHRVCSTMMGLWTSLPQNLALTKPDCCIAGSSHSWKDDSRELWSFWSVDSGGNNRFQQPVLQGFGRS